MKNYALPAEASFAFAAFLAATPALAVPIAITNHSFETDENAAVDGGFSAGSRGNFLNDQLTGWIAQSGATTAVAVGWKDILTAELHPNSPVGAQESQALSLQTGASVLNRSSTAWASLTEGEVITLTMSLGMRDVGTALNWNESTFFGLTDSDADLSTIELADTVANSGIIANNPATGTQTGDGTFVDSFFTYTVQAADLARPGNIGILIYSEGTGGPSSGANQSFFDKVRLDRTGHPGLGLVAHYTFDSESEGITPDEIGSNFATLGGRVQINTTPGEARLGTGALEMLGVDATAGPSDGAVTDNSFDWGADARTISFWWRQDGASTSGGAFVSMGDDGTGASGTRFEVKEQHATGDLRVEVQGTGLNTNPTDFDDGNWHFVAVTVPDNATFADVAWYVDGDRTDLNTSTSTLDLATLAGPIAFGDTVLTVPAGGRVPFGFLDDARIHNRVLTEDEIALLAKAPGPLVMAPIEFVGDDQPGFDLWPEALTGTSSIANFVADPEETSGTVTINVTASSSLQVTLNRGSTNGTPPGYSYQNLYEDGLFADSPTGALTLDVSGLHAGETYRFTLFSWDPAATDTTDKEWSVTGGTGVPMSNLVNYQAPLVDNATFAMVFDITADGSGAFQLTNTNGLPQSLINGFTLETAPITGGDTFADWIGGFPAVGLLDGLDDDPDGDGIDNGVENFFGTNPAVFSQGIVLGAVAGNTFTFTHPQGTLASDLSSFYRWSKDLSGFNPDGATDGGGTTVDFATSTDAGITTVTATVSGTAINRLFVRVKVTP